MTESETGGKERKGTFPSPAGAVTESEAGAVTEFAQGKGGPGVITADLSM